LVAVLVLGPAACQNPGTPSLPLEDLLAAPLEIAITGRQFTLESFVYRDFMPGDNAGGSALIAVVNLTAADLQPFPADIDGTRIWVVNGERVWETDFSDESRPRDQARLHQLQKVARDGPKWNVGTQVEVIVRVKTRTGSSHLLRAAKQTIQAVL
jgi:hypothetical protein